MSAGRKGLEFAAGQVASTYAKKPEFIESVAVTGCDGKPYRYVVAGFRSLKNPSLVIFTILAAEGDTYRYVHASATDGPPSLVIDQVRHPELNRTLPFAGCQEKGKGTKGWTVE